MIDDYAAGRNELFSQFATILPSATAIVGEPLRVVYQGVTGTVQNGTLISDKEPTDKFFVRVSIQTANRGQANLTGNDLKRRYNSGGLIFAQIYAPSDKMENYEIASRLASLIITAFDGKQTENCIWFRNTRIRELPKDLAWWRMDVLSEYDYDEIA